MPWQVVSQHRLALAVKSSWLPNLILRTFGCQNLTNFFAVVANCFGRNTAVTFQQLLCPSATDAYAVRSDPALLRVDAPVFARSTAATEALTASAFARALFGFTAKARRPMPSASVFPVLVCAGARVRAAFGSRLCRTGLHTLHAFTRPSVPGPSLFRDVAPIGATAFGSASLRAVLVETALLNLIPCTGSAVFLPIRKRLAPLAPNAFGSG